MDLAQAPKGFRVGTHRTVSPEATLQKLEPVIAGLGITRVANVTGLDSIGIPVVMVCRPNSRALSVSQGKGPTLDGAKASGLMESVESYHAERIHLPLILGTHNELRESHPLMNLDRMARPKRSVFHSDWRTLWIEGRDLVGEKPKWLPFEMVHTDLRVPSPAGSGAFFMSSNGLASGNHLLEAISHGICEVIERDASSLWFARSREGRAECRLDLDSVDDPGCRRVLELYAEGGVAVAVWETTTDVGIPAFDCLIVASDPNPSRPLPAAFGAGCHISREVALMRALTEAAQSRLTSIAGSRDDLDRPRHERARSRDTLRELHALITDDSGARLFADAPVFLTESFDEDVELELQSLREAGLEEVVVVDLTRRELGIPVVKVIIPGLEFPHRMTGYTPGPRARSQK